MVDNKLITNGTAGMVQLGYLAADGSSVVPVSATNPLPRAGVTNSDVTGLPVDPKLVASSYVGLIAIGYLDVDGSTVIPVSAANPLPGSGGGGGGVTSDAAIVQISPAAKANGTTTVTLPAAATPGNMVVLFGIGNAGGSAPAPAPPAGFNRIARTYSIAAGGGNEYIFVYAKTAVEGDQSFPVTSSDYMNWIAYEISDMKGIFVNPTLDGTLSAFEYFIPLPVVSKGFNIWVATHDTTPVITINPETGITVDYIDPGTNGNHTAAVGHTDDDWYGWLSGNFNSADNMNVTAFMFY